MLKMKREIIMSNKIDKQKSIEEQKNNIMIITDVVKKLVGNIQPYGASHIDEERFENLKTMCKLVNELVAEIDSVAYENKDRYEFSMKQMADYASNFLSNTLGINE